MAEEKKGFLERIKNSRIVKVLLFTGAMAGATTAMPDSAEAAQEQAKQVHVTMKNVHVMPGAAVQTPQQEFAQITQKQVVLARQKMVAERTGNVEKLNAIQKELESLKLRKAILAHEMAEQQKMQTQSQPEVQQSWKLTPEQAAEQQQKAQAVQNGVNKQAPQQVQQTRQADQQTR